MAEIGYRSPHQSFLKEFRRGECIDHRKLLLIRQNFPQRRCGAFIIFDIPFKGFIGKMKITFSGKPLVPQERDQIFHQLGKKFPVTGGIGLHIPMKTLCQTLPDFHQDLRSEFCPPLGKEVGHFKIFDPALSPQIDPAFEPGEVKGIFPVLIRNIQQLCRGPLPSDPGIQRHTPQGSQNHIPSMGGIIQHILFQQIPERF